MFQIICYNTFISLISGMFLCLDNQEISNDLQIFEYDIYDNINLLYQFYNIVNDNDCLLSFKSTLA